MGRVGFWCWAALVVAAPSAAAGTFRLATYNVENYVLADTASRQAKSQAAIGKVTECIQAAKPDVLALQELGGSNALLQLRLNLKAIGLNFAYWTLVPGHDTNVQVGVLSRFPITANRSHTNLSFLLQGRRFHVSRGFAELEIQVSDQYQFTLFTTHLKSKRQVPEADEAALRSEEAKLLRERVDARLAADPNRNIVVLGDFNDTKDSAAIKAIVGRGRTRLVDTRPAERNGDNQLNPNPNWEPRNVTWTHYFGREDSYSRIDYLLLSPGMAREWIPQETYIPAVANWGVASDHRAIVATIEAEDR